jgi:hypothetical protein
MVAFSSVLLALGSVASVLASPVNMTEGGALNLITRATSPGTGTHDGFFYSFWTDGQGQVTYNNEVSSKSCPVLRLYIDYIRLVASTPSHGTTLTTSLLAKAGTQEVPVL